MSANEQPSCFRCGKQEDKMFFPAMNVFTTDLPGLPKIQVAQMTFDKAFCMKCQMVTTIQEVLTDSLWWKITKKCRNDFDKMKRIMPKLDRSATVLGWRLFKQI